MKELLIEFSGTPASGKNTIAHQVPGLIQGHTWATIRANHFEAHYVRGAENFELKVLWSIFDTYSEIVQKSSESNADIILINRGIFDRIAWARLLSLENSKYNRVAEDLERWLKESQFLYRLDMIFLFLTSFEKVQRRKKTSKPRRVINYKTINALNQIYLDLYAELGNRITILKIDDINQDVDLSQMMTIVSSEVTALLREKLNQGV